MITMNIQIHSTANGIEVLADKDVNANIHLPDGRTHNIQEDIAALTGSDGSGPTGMVYRSQLPNQYGTLAKAQAVEVA